MATWCKELTHWKRPRCWGRLKVGGEGDDRGWDGWMASLTQRTWIWAGSRSWWWTGKPGVLQSMGSQRVGHDWVTELTEDFISVADIPSNGIVGSYGNSVFKILRNYQIVFQSSCTISDSYQHGMRIIFLLILLIPVVICLVDINYLSGYKVVSPYGFDLHFLVSKMLSIFPCVFICLCIVFEDISIQVLWTFINWVICLCCWVVKLLYASRMLGHYHIWDLQIFSLIHWVVYFLLLYSVLSWTQNFKFRLNSIYLFCYWLCLVSH